MDSSSADDPVFGPDNVKTVGRPNVWPEAEDAFLDAVRQALATGFLTNGGPYVDAFEARLAERIGVDHAVAVCNATIGLQVAARGLGLASGDEVIVPSFTFVATASAFTWLGVDVRFCDVDRETACLDVASAERLITSRTKAIVPVHVFGRLADTKAIDALAKRHDLAVIYDAAHAFATAGAGRSGACEVFSLHATKMFHTFEGGVITTNDGALADRLRALRNFGFETYDRVTEVGINAKMCEIQAAYGLAAFDKVDAIVAHNRANYEAYVERLGGIDGIRILAKDDGDNYHYVAIEWDAATLVLSRETLLNLCLEQGIRLRRYFYPGVHSFKPFKDREPMAASWLPVTTGLVQRIVCLPNGLHMTLDDVDKVCNVIVGIAENALALSDRLA